MSSTVATLFAVVQAVIAIGFLTGCRGPKQGEMAREWSRLIREQQVVPMFPPREDVRIGDAYLSRTDPNQDPRLSKQRGTLDIPLLIARTPLEGELAKHYRNRPPYPLTPTNALEKSALVTTNIATATNANGVVVTNISVVSGQALMALPSAAEVKDDNIFAPAKPDRLRHVAFPEFSFARISGSSLQAVVPAQSLNVALAGTTSSAKEAYVRISSGESISMPGPVVLDALFQSVCDTNGYVKAYLTRILDGEISQGVPSGGPMSNVLYLTVINEVFYARTIDIEFGAKNSAGAGVNIAGSPATNALNATSAAAERIRELNLINADLLANSVPGASFTFTMASDFGVGLRRTYVRPMAIGYRGMVVAVTNTPSGWRIATVQSVQQGPLLFTPEELVGQGS